MTVEERVDRLENVFAAFMMQTSTTIARMDRLIAETRAETAELKTQAEQDRQVSEQAMRQFREALAEFGTQAEQDRRASDQSMRQFREALTEFRTQAEQERQASERSMAEFRIRAEQDHQASERSMAEFRTQAEQDRQASERSMAEFRTQAEQDRQASEQAMRQFRAQMAEFSTRMTESSTRADKDREASAQAMRQFRRELGDIAHKLGTVVEDIIAPSIRRLAREELGCGEELDFTVRRWRARVDDPTVRREFDALYVGAQAVLCNESKATARPEYAREFVAFLESGDFFRYFPELVGQPVIPVFSSLYVPADVVTYLTRQGIYVVGMGDEAMSVLNAEAVRAQGVRRIGT